MYTLKIINTDKNKEQWFELGHKFSIEYDKHFDSCSNWIKEDLSCHVYDSQDTVYEIFLDEEAYILNESGKTLKVINWKGHKANINSKLKE